MSERQEHYATGANYGRCVTHHICACFQAELDCLRAENATLRDALTVLANGGDFGAVDVPAHTGDIYIALQRFANGALDA